MRFLVVAVLSGVVALGGCAAYTQRSLPPSDSNLTAGVVKREIVKGQTTQAEILELFGSPNLVTMNRDDDEVWNYNRMSYETSTGADGGFAVFWSGTSAVSSTTTRSFDLVLVFDKNDVVKDYSVIQASY
jgi:outer membrane protein assembly factor BamE (lipoprotein component of BamABCDE complex)